MQTVWYLRKVASVDAENKNEKNIMTYTHTIQAVMCVINNLEICFLF